MRKVKVIVFIVLISLSVYSTMPLQYNPYDLAISTIASQEGWSRSQIAIQRGSHSRFLLVDKISIKLKVENSNSTETVYLRLHKMPLLGLTIDCYSVGDSDGCNV